MDQKLDYLLSKYVLLVIQLHCIHVILFHNPLTSITPEAYVTLQIKPFVILVEASSGLFPKIY